MIEIGKSGNESVAFDLATLIETRLLIQSSSGGGKSYAIRRLLEQSHGRVQQIVLDLEGEFSTLREKYDYIIAGKNGDTAAHPKSARLLATRVLELGVSIICDLYELKSHDRITFVRYFLESIMAAPRSLWHPVIIIVDEAHHFAPEKGQAESSTAVIDLCTRGRKRGFCAVLATQRLSKLHKDACAELANKMIGRTTLDIDQARAADELGLIGKDGRIALRNLNPGEFHIYGPAVRLKKEASRGVTLVKVGEVLSRHPKVGARQLEAPPRPTPKIREILGKLADLPADAEKQDRDLQAAEREVQDLKRRLTMAQKQPASGDGNHAKGIADLKSKNRLLEAELAAANEVIDVSHKSLDTEMARALSFFEKSISDLTVYRESKVSVYNKLAAVSTVAPKERPVRHNPSLMKRPADPDIDSDVTKPQQKILNALAAFESVGLESVAKPALAAFCEVSPTSGGYFNNLGALRSKGYINYPDPGHVALTESGRAMANVSCPIESQSDLQDAWLKVVSVPQAKILTVLIDIYPQSISKEELANTIRVSSTSGGYFNNLGRLRTLGAVEYPQPGQVKGSNLLFIEGLRS